MSLLSPANAATAAAGRAQALARATGTAVETKATTAETKSAQAKAKIEKDLNQFLKMLVTQLQNQDPLKPMDSTQFTQQLVQFASVEQQIYQNANLEKLVGIQQTSQVASMVNYLGTTIEANGSAFNLENGKGKFSYDLAEKAVDSTMTILDATGATVWTGAAVKDAGKQIYQWDGKKTDGTQAPDGPYTAVINAKDRKGKIIDVAQTVYGRVTGAGAQGGRVTLSMGAVDTLLENVLNVQKIPVIAAAAAAAAAAATTAAATTMAAAATTTAAAAAAAAAAPAVP